MKKPWKFLILSVVLHTFIRSRSCLETPGDEHFESNIKDASTCDYSKIVNANSNCIMRHTNSTSLCQGIYYSCNDNPNILVQGTLKSNTFDPNFDDIEYLSLRDDEIQNIEEDVFHKMQLLKILFLSSNTLKELPGRVFTNLSNLIYLDLSKNRLVTLPAIIFVDLTNLEVLDLRENNLNSLGSDTLFHNLHRLISLFLSSNRLEQLSDNQFISLKKLLLLQLINNKLTSITEKLLQPLESLKVLTLDENPIICNSEFKKMKSWCKNKSINLNINCTQLPSKADNNKREREKHANSNSNILIYVVIGILVLIVAPLMVYCIWLWKKKSKFTNRTEQQRISTSDVRTDHVYDYVASISNPSSTRTNPSELLNPSVVYALPQKTKASDNLKINSTVNQDDYCYAEVDLTSAEINEYSPVVYDYGKCSLNPDTSQADTDKSIDCKSNIQSVNNVEFIRLSQNSNFTKESDNIRVSINSLYGED